MHADFGRGDLDLKALQKLAGGGLIWVALAFLTVAILVLSTVRVGHVSGEQVGILLDRVTGKMSVINPGVKIYNGLLGDFHVLDKTLQTLEMTEAEGRGDRQGKDDLKIKTSDGSDVYVDFKVQYKINTDEADVVISTSGTGENYKQKWVRDYIRAMCRNSLGELNTEDFYDAGKRQEQISQAEKEVNSRLNPYGITIARITIPRRPRFYAEYELMIKEKKLADQAKLEEESKAKAAQQKQETELMKENNDKRVAIVTFDGEMQQKIIAAKAAAERAMREADAYFAKTTIDAGAKFYQMQKESEAVLARKKAEAEGIKVLNEALTGEGGRNMVKLEYARKLKDVTITGKPFTIQSSIERFEHLKGPASTGRE